MNSIIRVGCLFYLCVCVCKNRISCLLYVLCPFWLFVLPLLFLFVYLTLSFVCVSWSVCVFCAQQQLQAHQLSQLQGLALPMTPLPLGLTPPTLPSSSSSSTAPGLFSLSSILASHAHLAKEEKNARDAANSADTHRDDDGDKSD